MSKPKIITVCGSLKFQHQMMVETERLELEGNCVLSVVYSSPGFSKDYYSAEQEAMLDKMHKIKIDMSDAIFVINVGGYVGPSTKSEIEYAQKTGKEVMYLVDPNSIPKTQPSKIIRVGIGVIVQNKQGQILLGKRNKAKKREVGKLKADWDWSLPGGGLEWGETFEEGAAREVLEETDIKIKSPKMLCVYNDIDENAHWVTIGMFADKFSGTVKVNEPDTYTEWAWFDPNNLPENVFSASMKVIKKLAHTKPC